MSGLVRAIVKGYVWRQRITVESAVAVFPAGSAWTAHVRATVASEAVLATLTTANGGLVRVSDTALDIVLSAAQSAACAPGTVVLDLVRTDTDPDEHCGWQITIPVVLPVTRL